MHSQASQSDRHFARHYVEMLVAMLLRRDEYTGDVHRHGVREQVTA